MMPSEVEFISLEKNRTPELLCETVNRDPVTGYPVETTEARKTVLGILQEAIDNHKSVIYIDADIDNLKYLNDALGHKTANQGIKAVIENKENSLLSIKGVEAVLVYRPQAGGDEYKMLLLLENTPDNEENAIKTLRDILSPDTNFLPEGKSALAISCSYGITVKNPKGDKNPGELLQEMEEEAEERLVKEKMEKIEQKLRKTINKGSNLGTEKYIDLVVSEWGSRRLGEEVLRTLLESVSSKSSA